MAARAQLTARQRRFLIDQGYLVARSRLDQAVLSAGGAALRDEAPRQASGASQRSHADVMVTQARRLVLLTLITDNSGAGRADMAGWPCMAIGLILRTAW